MSVIFHAHFYLSLDRKTVNPTRETRPLNEYLRTELVKFFCEEVAVFVGGSKYDNSSFLAT